MPRDYKTPQRSSQSGTGFSGTSFALGALIGLLLGLGLALAVAWYINKVPSPFVNRMPVAPTDAAKSADDKAARGKDDKLRLEFHDILTGKKDPDVDRGPKAIAPPPPTGTPLPPAAETSPPPVTPKETLYLQAGAFQNPQEADNLKARLALLGHEATVQPTNVPDKGTWYRVRLGPYARVDELARARDNMRQNGIDATLVKIRDAENPGK